MPVSGSTGLPQSKCRHLPVDQDVSLDEALQRQKLKDLRKVDKNMGVVQDMYHQLHGEVVKQQETIDAVDEQIEQAKDSTGKVVEELQETHHSKKKNFWRKDKNQNQTEGHTTDLEEQGGGTAGDHAIEGESSSSTRSRPDSKKKKMANY
ncbi:hypothetical protein Pmar_PMAR005269 [Perkinsus marinus ATCC 50983]|uniref:t-SNARE coiled-coil homology domain-containing protein n=1 Tax=Perkinsus marinus (strain ATCC 50983 / TXsc) TaxID=423536 RepID=C5KB33_PERM5|nr:hypothetical protein Pmar_PMAR005269 [Perkinsus marinus ATCC 50983]EER18359.1 hypothetical protein Pmar_PMAR005269 [Perkinsus marinus ATCC 50983]|eukprot:XP_002786563.1 hypothetical protein Pmar_PMAR005269 [Perkinsus marinus ATCC 50983]